MIDLLLKVMDRIPTARLLCSVLCFCLHDVNIWVYMVTAPVNTDLFDCVAVATDPELDE